MDLYKRIRERGTTLYLSPETREVTGKIEEGNFVFFKERKGGCWIVLNATRGEMGFYTGGPAAIRKNFEKLD